MIKLLE